MNDPEAMTKSELYTWLHKADWTTKCDIAPVDPNKYLNEYSAPQMNGI